MKTSSLKKQYKILELKEGVELAEIKASYKKLALQYHPDKNPDGLEQFKKINEAYQILSKALQPAPEPISGASGSAPKPRRRTAAEEAQEELDEELFRMYQSYMEAMRQQEEERLARTTALFTRFQSTKVTWLVFAALWLVVLAVNHVFDTHFDWLVLAIFSALIIVFKFKKPGSKLTVRTLFAPSTLRLGALVSYALTLLLFELIVIYFAAPNAVLYRGANLAFITCTVVLLNLFKIQVDVSVLIWVVLVAFEFIFRAVPKTSPGMLAAHSITCLLTLRFTWRSYQSQVAHVIPSGSAHVLAVLVQGRRLITALDALVEAIASRLHFRIEAVLPLAVWALIWALKAVARVNFEWLLTFMLHSVLMTDLLWARNYRAFYIYLALRSVPTLVLYALFPFKLAYVETVASFLLHVTISSTFMSREFRLQWLHTKERPNLKLFALKHVVTFVLSFWLERKYVPVTLTPQWSYFGVQSFLDCLLATGWPIISGIYTTPPPLDDDSENSDDDSSEDEETVQQAEFQQFRQNFYQNFGPLITNARPRDPMERARQKKTQRQAAKVAKTKAQSEMSAANRRNKRK